MVARMVFCSLSRAQNFGFSYTHWRGISFGGLGSRKKREIPDPCECFALHSVSLRSTPTYCSVDSIDSIVFAGTPRTHRPHVRHDQQFDTEQLELEERIAERVYLDSQTGLSAINSVDADLAALSSRGTPGPTYASDGNLIRLHDYALGNNNPSNRIS